MKSVSLFLLTAAAGLCAEFTTGQAARLAIGQIHFTREEYGASEYVLGGVSGLAYGNNTLFIADANRVGSIPINNRVLIYRDISSQLPKPTDELFYTSKCPVCVGKADVVLGQPDFHSPDHAALNGNPTPIVAPTRQNLRVPTAVATDGRIVVVADTDNNRVLIWNSIPTSNNQPADVVIGQANFTSNSLPGSNGSFTPTAASLRGPQGVWIQDGRLYIADTQNHRVLIYNSIPTQNGAAADVVLGQPDFTTFVQPDLTQAGVDARPDNLLNPVSVTSDGVRLFVTDLGHNRVLVWNTIPRSNRAPADFALGQLDVNSAVVNDVKRLCSPTGNKDEEGNDIYPGRCNATLNFPRFALSDGQRLFVADGGNDRVLVWNSIPTQSGKPADVVLGQIASTVNLSSEATDALRTPMSLAWDGANLYVSDSFNRRVMVFSLAEPKLPYTAVRNAASRAIYAVGTLSIGGQIKENDEIAIKIADKEYKYKVVKDDTFPNIINQLVTLINADGGDPKVVAFPNILFQGITLSSRLPGEEGNATQISVAVSDGATITGTASGATLAGGGNAAQVAPGTIVTILGEDLSAGIAAAPADADPLPLELAGTQVYLNGIRANLFYVSPTQINTQIPFEFNDTTSISAYVRSVRPDGSVMVTNPVGVVIVPENPGIFTYGGDVDPRPAVAVHSSSAATGTVSVDGTAKAGDIATVKIEDRSYSYTVKEGDTLATIRDALIALINQDEKVEAVPAGVFTRIRLRARIPGPEGNGITYGVNAVEGSQVILTPTGSALCCANTAGAPVTEDNPAVPGETIIVYATGLGLPTPADGVSTGERFKGGPNEPVEFVSSLAGGKTANVLYAGLQSGQVGVYEVHLELNSDIPTNPATQLTIAQFVYVSNVVTLPVYNPNPPAPAEGTP
jgi:hypothetical protein